MNAREW
jgi:hypothetical protein